MRGRKQIYSDKKALFSRPRRSGAVTLMSCRSIPTEKVSFLHFKNHAVNIFEYQKVISMRRSPGSTNSTPEFTDPQ